MHDNAARRRRMYNHERSDMAIGGITPMQTATLAVWLPFWHPLEARGSPKLLGERKRGKRGEHKEPAHDSREQGAIAMQDAMKKSVSVGGKACVLALLMVPGLAAQAATCEENFQADGDPGSGLTFVSGVERPELSINSALGQLQKLAADDGDFEIGSISIQGDKGEVSFTDVTKNPAVVMWATADSSGTVLLGTKLAPRQRMNPEVARTYFCGMLNKLKAGQEGEAIAAQGAAAARDAAETGGEQGDSRPVIDAQAVELSKQVGSELDDASSSLRRKSQLKSLLVGRGRDHTQRETTDVLAPVVNKYLGRRYRVDGELYTVSKSAYSNRMEAAFLVTRQSGLLGIGPRQSSSANNHNFTIKCVFAEEDAGFFSTLMGGDKVALTGTVVEFFPGAIAGSGHNMLGAGMTLFPCKP